MGRNQYSLPFLEKKLTNETIQIQTMVAGWQQYLINMEIPYEKGATEGTSFCFQWTSIIFNVNIQIWSFTDQEIKSFVEKLLKNLVAQNWSKLERLERARKNDLVDVNGTENRRCMRKLFNFEFSQFQ